MGQEGVSARLDVPIAVSTKCLTEYLCLGVPAEWKKIPQGMGVLRQGVLPGWGQGGKGSAPCQRYVSQKQEISGFKVRYKLVWI